MRTSSAAPPSGKKMSQLSQGSSVTASMPQQMEQERGHAEGEEQGVRPDEAGLEQAQDRGGALEEVGDTVDEAVDDLLVPEAPEPSGEPGEEAHHRGIVDLVHPVF